MVLILGSMLSALSSMLFALRFFHVLGGSQLLLQSVFPVQLEDAGDLLENGFCQVLRYGFAERTGLESSEGFDRFRPHGRMNRRRLSALQTGDRASFGDKDRKPLSLVNPPASATLFQIDPVSA